MPFDAVLLPAAQMFEPFLDMMRNIARSEIALFGVVPDEIGDGYADANEAGRIVEQFQIAAVPRDEVEVGIDDADSGADIFEGRGEQPARKAQALPPFVEQPRDFVEAELAARERRGDERARRGGTHDLRDQFAGCLLYTSRCV